MLSEEERERLDRIDESLTSRPLHPPMALNNRDARWLVAILKREVTDEAAF